MRLDLGCGSRRRFGYIGMDKWRSGTVDIVCDLEQGFPIESDSVDGIYCHHFLEHVSNLPFLMKEIFRVCRPGALVEVTVPYYASVGAFKDPTHVNFFTEETFRYFSKDHWYGSDYGFDVHFQMKKIRYLYMPPFHKVSLVLPFVMPLLRRHLINVIHSMTVELEVIKEHEG